jgi:hypothetical protein
LTWYNFAAFPSHWKSYHSPPSLSNFWIFLRSLKNRFYPGEVDHKAALEKEKLVAGVEATIEERQHQVPKAAPRSYRDFLVLVAAIVIVGLVLMVLLR